MKYILVALLCSAALGCAPAGSSIQSDQIDSALKAYQAYDVCYAAGFFPNKPGYADCVQAYVDDQPMPQPKPQSVNLKTDSRT